MICNMDFSHFNKPTATSVAECIADKTKRKIRGRCFPLLQPQLFSGTSDGRFMLESFQAGLNNT